MATLLAMRKPITSGFLALIFTFWMLGSAGPTGAIENLAGRSTDRDCPGSHPAGPARGPDCPGATPSPGTSATPSPGTSSTTTSSTYTTTTSTTSLPTTTTLQPNDDNEDSKVTSRSDKDQCLNSLAAAVGKGLDCSDATSPANFPATGTSSTSSTTTVALQPKGSDKDAESNSQSDEDKCPNYHPVGLAKALNCSDPFLTELVSSTGTSTSTTTTTSVPPPSDSSGEMEVSVEADDSIPAAESTTTSLPSPTTPTTTVAPYVELDVGTSKIEVNGRSVESNQIQVGNEITVEGGNVIARLSGAEGIPFDSENSGLTFVRGKSAQLSLQGLRPDSEVRVVIFSEPRQLGILTVDSMGGFLASIEIPTDLAPGSHTLVLSGFNKVGSPIELKFGVAVNQSGEPLVPFWVWPTIALCMLALAGFVIRARKVNLEKSEFWKTRLRGGTL